MSKIGVSIAVMPFRNLSADTDTDYFADGFVEDLTADLTRFSSLRVFATQSTFAWESLDPSSTENSQDLEPDFFLRGSVRRGKSNIRIGVQLIRALGNETIWAERFDVPLEEIFEIQDRITATVAGQLAVHVDDESLQYARQRSVESLPAYECYLRGMDCLKRGTLEGDDESRDFFQQALRVDSEYARAYSGLSLSHFNEWTCHAWHLWDINERNAFDYASKAVELDDRDAMAHSVLSRVYRFRHQHTKADDHAARALALNANDAHVLIQVAIVKLFGGEPGEGVELARKAVTLNPLHSRWYLGVVGWNLFMLDQHEEANRYFDKAGETITNYAAYRAACAAIAGDSDRAQYEFETFVREYREKIAFGREPEPGEALTWAIQVEPFRRMEDSRRMPDALRDVGIVEVNVPDALNSRGKQMVIPAGISRPPGNVFRGEDGLWTIDYDGTGARLTELKGFHDIARLLAQPGEPLHCLELFGPSVSNDSADEVLDTRARREYRRRIEELQMELEQAEVDNDPARADSAREELDGVIEQLAKATGLGGRSRKMNTAAERARSAVTWRIRSAIKKVRAAHPRLGQHFSNSIRTGNFCVYSPEIKIDWEL